MRILVCGSRSWNDPGPIARELEKAVHVPGVEAAQVTVIHGAARGADSIAGNVAHEFGYQVIACPADWNRFGRAAGPIRNQQMLKDHQPELVLFDEPNSGLDPLTSDTIDALFWWRRLVQSSRSYYSGLSIRRMFTFSEHRARLHFVHIAPGRYDVRLSGGPLPSMTTESLTSGTRATALPKQVAIDLDQASGAEASTVPAARYATARRNVAMALQALPDTTGPPSPPLVTVRDHGDDDGESGDCDGCDTHLDRSTPGIKCSDITCSAMKCKACHPGRANWHCSAHTGMTRKRTRAPRR